MASWTGQQPGNQARSLREYLRPDARHLEVPKRRLKPFYLPGFTSPPPRAHLTDGSTNTRKFCKASLSLANVHNKRFEELFSESYVLDLDQHQVQYRFRVTVGQYKVQAKNLYLAQGKTVSLRRVFFLCIALRKSKANELSPCELVFPNLT